MPIYEYRCQLCGHALEKLQKMSDPDLLDCPSCQAPGLRRLVSAAGFQLKGSGWYATDFKGTKPASAEAVTSVASSKTETTSAASSTTTATDTSKP